MAFGSLVAELTPFVALGIKIMPCCRPVPLSFCCGKVVITLNKSHGRVTWSDHYNAARRAARVRIYLKAQLSIAISFVYPYDFFKTTIKTSVFCLQL